MTEDDIAAVFIKAAEVEMLLPSMGEKPVKNPRGYVLPWVHEAGDINMRRREAGLWSKPKSKRSLGGEKLQRGDDPLNEWRWGWLFDDPLKVEPGDVSLWETCIEWTGALLDNEGQRRALWAWAFSKAGGKPFKRWCEKVEHVSRTIGLKRKNDAITRIYAQLVRSDVQNIENGDLRDLQVYTENGDIAATVGSEDGKRDDPNFWNEDAAFKSFIPTYTKHKDGEISVEDRQFSIRAARNAERRARYARLKAA